MTARVRPARPGDAGAICAIWNPVIRDTLVTFTTVEKAPDDIAAQIAAARAPFLVAEQDGAVVGFTTYGSFRGGPGYGHTAELSIMLAPAAQGRGIGRALMQALEEEARAAGLHVLIAGISGENPGAIAFHARMGFGPALRLAQVGQKAGRYLDLVLMQKIL